jgi:hypothetical protein
MTAHIKVGGVWKEVAQTYVKVGGAWKPADNVYVKAGGVWKAAGLPKLAAPVVASTACDAASACTYTPVGYVTNPPAGVSIRHQLSNFSAPGGCQVYKHSPSVYGNKPCSNGQMAIQAATGVVEFTSTHSWPAAGIQHNNMPNGTYAFDYKAKYTQAGFMDSDWSASIRPSHNMTPCCACACG